MIVSRLYAQHAALWHCYLPLCIGDIWSCYIALVFAIARLHNIQKKIDSINSFFLIFFKNLVSINQMKVHDTSIVLALCALKKKIKKADGLFLRKFVFDVCMFCFISCRD